MCIKVSIYNEWCEHCGTIINEVGEAMVPLLCKKHDDLADQIALAVSALRAANLRGAATKLDEAYRKVIKEE